MFQWCFGGENIINTWSGSCFVDKMAVCLHFYLQTITIEWLFAHMSRNKQSMCEMAWLGSMTMCTVYTNNSPWVN